MNLTKYLPIFHFILLPVHKCFTPDWTAHKETFKIFCFKENSQIYHFIFHL